MQAQRTELRLFAPLCVYGLAHLGGIYLPFKRCAKRLVVAAFEVEGFGCLGDHSACDHCGEHHHEGKCCPIGERVGDHWFVWFPFRWRRITTATSTML